MARGVSVGDEATESIPVARVDVGDVITLPGTSVHACRVQVARSAVPGVVWLYLADSMTGERLRGHVALPVNQTVLRHRAGGVSGADRVPEES